MRIGKRGIDTRGTPFLNFSGSKRHLCNGTKYGHLVKDFRLSALGTKGIGFNRITTAQVVYPSVALRRGILRTLGGITKCRAMNRSMTLGSTRNGPMVLLRGHRITRMSMGSLGNT